ncbi:hypothetical protein F4558_002764 [Micromonospora profundi]|nr:hypothetical protein [Micromonospora profundi]
MYSGRAVLHGAPECSGAVARSPYLYYRVSGCVVHIDDTEE